MPKGVPGSGPAKSTQQLLQRASNDPYSFAMRSIVTGLEKGLDNSDRMSEVELETLKMIEDVIRYRDPASLEIRTNQR